MKEKCFEKNRLGLFVSLVGFFFVRTALMSPVYCLLMNPDYPYFRFSVESVVFIVLLLVFSVLSAILVFAFKDKAGDIAAFIYIIAMADPLFFATQDNPLKLFVNIVIQLFVLSVLKGQKTIPFGVLFLVTVFITVFMVPYSILGYVPGMLALFSIVCRKTGKDRECAYVIMLGIACAIAGFLLNGFLNNESQFFADFFSSFSFAEENEVNQYSKILTTILPTVVFGIVFFHFYLETEKNLVKKKKKHTNEFVMDAFFLPALIAFISMFFTASEGFCTINLLIPSIVLVLLCLKDECCIKTMERITDFVKDHKVITIVVFVAIFALSITGIINYHSGKQLIFYLRY